MADKVTIKYTGKAPPEPSRSIGMEVYDLGDEATQRAGVAVSPDQAHVLVSGGYGYKYVEPLGGGVAGKTLDELAAERQKERAARKAETAPAVAPLPTETTKQEEG